MRTGDISPTVSDLGIKRGLPPLIRSVASDVCKDLVLYDNTKDNQFRQLIPLAHKYPVLMHIIVANSAIRMFHAGLGPPKSCESSHLSEDLPALRHQHLFAHPHARSYALGAKSRALYLLQSMLSGDALTGPDVTLAVILLFTEFELLDSGRDNWTHHISGARRIIEKLYDPNILSKNSMSPLRKFLISNCLVYVVSLQPCGTAY